MALLDTIDLSQKVRNLDIFLARPDMTIVGILKEAYNKDLHLQLNSIHELKFEMPVYLEIDHQLQLNPNAQTIREGHLLKAVVGTDYRWFIITKITKVMDQDKDIYQIDAFSLGYELKRKRIHKYKVDSVSCSQAISDIVAGTNWNVGSIESSISAKVRSFDMVGRTGLDAILEVAAAFDVLMVLDEINRLVNLVAAENIGTDKGLRFTLGHYLRGVNYEINMDDMCTRLKVYGKNDISIQDQNPNGQSYIEDYSRFLSPFARDAQKNVITHSDYMSDSLANAILDYNDLITLNKTTYSNYLASLATYQSTLTTQQNDMFNLTVQKTQVLDTLALLQDAKNVASYTNTYNGSTLTYTTPLNNFYSYAILCKVSSATNLTVKLDNVTKTITANTWTVLGKLGNGATTTSVQFSGTATNVTVNIVVVSILNSEYTATGNESAIITKYCLDYTQNLINLKQVDINTTNNNITTVNNNIATLRNTLSYANNFTSAQLTELQSFVIEKELVESNYSDSKSLYDYATSKILEINVPQLIVKIDIVNFLQCIEEQWNWDKLVLGDLVTILYEPMNIDINAKISEIQYNFESGEIQLTISNAKIARHTRHKYIKYIYNTANNVMELNNKRYNWDLIGQNFDSRNDRKSTVPADPVVASDGTAITSILNDDGSADIHFNWSYTAYNAATPNGDQYDIDGFIVYVRSLGINENYTFGSNLASEKTYTYQADKRSAIVTGLVPNRYYTFGVQAYRHVDPDINSNGILTSNVIKSTAVNQDPYQPSGTVNVNGNLTGTNAQVNGTPVASITTATSNFGNRNNRNSTTPTTPTIANDATAISIQTNDDGSVDITFDWNYTNGTGNTNPATIDGFYVYTYSSSSSSAYTIGTSSSLEHVLVVKYDQRSVTLYGVSPTKYYTFGVRAYRVVDADINPNGVLVSAIVQPSYASYNPFKPSSVVNINGNVTGTNAQINGTAASTVVTNAGNGNIAYSGTSNTIRNSNPIVNLPTVTGTPFSIFNNPDGSADITVTWAYTESSTSPINGFGIIVYSSGSSTAHTPSITDTVYYVDKASTTFTLYGINPTNYFTFGLFAYRSVDTSVTSSGIIRSNFTTVNPSGNPLQISTGVTVTASISGISTINGVSASTVTTNAGNGNTAYSQTSNTIRNSNAITNVPVAGTTPISVTTNPDSSVDITINWTYTESSTSPINGFGIAVYANTSSTTHTPSLSDTIYYADKSTTNFTIYGANPTTYYTFGIFAYRIVDTSINSGGIIRSTITIINSGGTAYQPATSANFTGSVNGVGASVVSNATTNFNNRNDRMADIPATATGLTLANNLNTDGSADIVFSWAFSGTDNAHNIDGFQVYVYSSTTNATYTIGTSPSLERIYHLPPNQTSFVLYGVTPDRYYTFGVRAVRMVDHDIWSSVAVANQITGDGIVGAIATATPNPYQPSTTPNFTGNVGGTSAGTISTATTNFNSRNDRLSDIPAIPTGLTVNSVLNANGSADLAFSWTFSGSDNQHNIDGFMVSIYTQSSNIAYTFGTSVSAEKTITLDSSKTSYILHGVSPSSYYTFGVRAFRVVDHDVWNTVAAQYQKTGDMIVGSIATYSPNPYQPSSSPNYTGNINGTSASTIAYNSTTSNINLLQNGGSEICTGRFGANIPDGWLTWQPSTLCTFTRRVNDSSWTISGNSSFEINYSGTATTNTNGAYFQDYTRVSAGETYTLSALLEAHRCSGWIRFEYYDSSNTMIGSDNSTSITNISTPTTMTLTKTLPTNCTKLRCLLWKDVQMASQTSSYLFADTVKLEKGSFATPYVEIGNSDAINNATKTSSTVIIADGSTTLNPLRADYVVPAGATNAQDTINTAINALPASGGKIVLLEGTYNVNGAINLKSNVSLEGQGTGTVIKRPTGVTPVFYCISAIGCSNISLESFCVDGSNYAISNGGNNGAVYCGSSTSGIKINNLTVQNWKNSGVGFTGVYGIRVQSCSNLSITNCTFTGNNTCPNILVLDTNNSTIDKNTISASSSNGIYYNGTVDAYNISITNNKISSCSVGIWFDISTGIKTYNSLINNNIITSMTQQGIKSFNGYYTTISGNIIDTASVGIDASDSTSTFITNNIVRNTSDNGINYVQINNGNVSNNVLNGCQTSSLSACLNVVGSYNTIQSNTIRLNGNTAGYAIRVGSGTGNYVTNNDCINGYATSALSDSGTSTNIGSGNRV
ncbi:phage tail spike protein [Paenibacillus cremeus]|uniref:Fibronectin type-III domain-containing protein n=1 Tax=Paenibacillus cremeus TaxID=2163881 RepID=A0A559KCW8_9BACL|nr:phage tail spike protein [Paenibacillus cremeus]TVY09986.1 hypothetical protein FPZ49_11485 [Paenibacillus cremeus]